MESIIKLYDEINVELFTIRGTDDWDDITQKIIKLAKEVHSYDGESDDLWSLGECGYCSLPDFIVGAYWHYTQWHEGQLSDSYAALSALGSTFSPGMTSEPDRDDPEWFAFTCLEELAQKKLEGSKS